jgi:membrane protein YdbS with pleckstrin-like domain
VSRGESLDTLRPSEAWLRYLKLQFWIGIGIFSFIFTAILVVLLVFAPPVGMLLALPWAVIVFVPNAVGLIALYLRYDTTWYVLTSRSMRIRRGIWILRETTITYENIQNVAVTQGPLERFYGIANVVVKTAGGGGGHGPHGQDDSSSTHVGLLEGLTNAHEIRELILSRVRESGQAGLGDEAIETRGAWRPHAAHVVVLREIRDALRAAV